MHYIRNDNLHYHYIRTFSKRRYIFKFFLMVKNINHTIYHLIYYPFDNNQFMPMILHPQIMFVEIIYLSNRSWNDLAKKQRSFSKINLLTNIAVAYILLIKKLVNICNNFIDLLAKQIFPIDIFTLFISEVFNFISFLLFSS